MSKNVRIFNFLIPEELNKKLEEYSEATERSKSHTIRFAIKELIKKKRKGEEK